MSNKSPIPWSAAEIIEATRGELLCGELQHRFSGVSIDSRNILVNEVFVAIAGTVHDGHIFASDIVAQGVRGMVINRNQAPKMPLEAWKTNGITCIAVDDTTIALGDMASYNRRRSQARVVGITGSNGKTTTRQMTAAVLARQHETLTPVGNFNNEIGLPLTLLALTPAHEWAILELGTNNPGEIGRLADICTPDIGVLTNIGPAHLQGLGSIEGVMQEKGDLLRRLKPDDKAVLNADDPRVMQMARVSKAGVILYGLSEDAMIRAENIRETEQAITFRLIFAGEDSSVRLNSPGRYMVSNALAAAAVGYQIGLSCETVKAGLEAFSPVSGRMNIKQMQNGIFLIDDTYNANPDSMKVAFGTLSTLRAGSRGVLVLGDMLELGPQAQSLHGEVGALAARSGISLLYAFGEFANDVTAGACKEGMPPADTFVGTQADIITDLKHRLLPGDWILVKGSRSMAMEKVVQALIAWSKEPGD